MALRTQPAGHPGGRDDPHPSRWQPVFRGRWTLACSGTVAAVVATSSRLVRTRRTPGQQSRRRAPEPDHSGRAGSISTWRLDAKENCRPELPAAARVLGRWRGASREPCGGLQRPSGVGGGSEPLAVGGGLGPRTKAMVHECLRGAAVQSASCSAWVPGELGAAGSAVFVTADGTSNASALSLFVGPFVLHSRGSSARGGLRAGRGRPIPLQSTP
jgi:hypothetical protein